MRLVASLLLLCGGSAAAPAAQAFDGRPLVAGRELLFDLRDWAAGVPDRKNFRTESLAKPDWPPGYRKMPAQ